MEHGVSVEGTFREHYSARLCDKNNKPLHSDGGYGSC